MSWNPEKYGQFLAYRTRPSRDLVARIPLDNPKLIVDLGCGPGNSTVACAERWPEASIIGLDSSQEMIQEARGKHPDKTWLVGGIAEWIDDSTNTGNGIDLIFSSAALQWVEHHELIFPRIVQKLVPGGVFACQMPAYDVLPNRTMRDMAASARWAKWFPSGRAKEWRSHSLNTYYDILTPVAEWVDLWAVDYFQILPTVNSIADWYKSTGLRPYLSAILDEEERQEFLLEFIGRLTPSYPRANDGTVPFPFRRIFMIAVRGN